MTAWLQHSIISSMVTTVLMQLHQLSESRVHGSTVFVRCGVLSLALQLAQWCMHAAHCTAVTSASVLQITAALCVSGMLCTTPVCPYSH